MDNFHNHIYEEATHLGTTVGIEESIPHLAGRQQHRKNVPADTMMDYYRRNLTIPLLDHIISELDSRFDSESSAVLVEFMQLLPSTLLATPSMTKSAFTKVLKLYKKIK